MSEMRPNFAVKKCLNDTLRQLKPKQTVFIKEMNDFGAINEVYAEFFTGDYPARSCVEVARLPKDVMIEMEAIALKKWEMQR